MAEDVYTVTDKFPRHELYGLSGQLRRAAVSIPSNIAEGSRQRTDRARAYYYTAANASEAEMQTQLELASRRRYASEPELRNVAAIANRVSMMLYKLIDSLNP